jgi:hypothetical protein
MRPMPTPNCGKAVIRVVGLNRSWVYYPPPAAGTVMLEPLGRNITDLLQTDRVLSESLLLKWLWSYYPPLVADIFRVVKLKCNWGD